MSFPLYFDDDSQSRAVITALRAADVECHWSAAEATEGSHDHVHLDFAARRGWALVTRNTGDFVALHTSMMQAGEQHRGIIIVSQRKRPSVGTEVRAMLAMQNALESADMHNRLEWLSNWA